LIVFKGKTQVLKNVQPIPRKYELREISEPELTPAQKEYLKPIDAQLDAMNYRPDCTFCAMNYGQNLMRRYCNPADPASCELIIVEVKSKVGNAGYARTVNTVSFTSRLSDGRRLITRNMPLRSVMDRLPHQIMQECANVTNLAALKNKHDVRAATLGPAVPPPHGAQAIFAEMQQEHERSCSYQLAQGILRLSADGNAYEITAKSANRGIRNFFNPFATRIGLPQVLFTALIGAVLPLFGILKLAPMTSDVRDPLLKFLGPGTLAILGCYALAGAIIGLSGGPASYPWVMAVSYIPAHLVAGWSFGWMPYSTMAYVVAYIVGQIRLRRRLVLQT
jgi:hypothetical protein